jgi:lysine 2,3-aminomutase
MSKSLGSTWARELREAFREDTDLAEFLGVEIPKTPFPLLIPKEFAQKIKNLGKNSGLWKQFIPDVNEVSPQNEPLQLNPGDKEEGEFFDPIGDLVNLKAPQIIHRYKNRALFLPTFTCPVICRFCFRKNQLNPSADIFQKNFDQALIYLKKNESINEVIFTGGDPLTLSDSAILGFLEKLKELPHIKFLRFHTRVPIILPSRINKNFLEILMLAKSLFKKVTLSIHCNHPDEIDGQIISLFNSLANTGINLLSQTVLLRGVNDNTECLQTLFEILVENGVRPYYLHHPDRVKGGLHFFLPIEEGRKIYHGLRNSLPGWAIPQYVLDLPGGKGKIPVFNPETFSFSGQIITKDGNSTTYPYL